MLPTGAKEHRAAFGPRAPRPAHPPGPTVRVPSVRVTAGPADGRTTGRRVPYGYAAGAGAGR